MIMKTDVVVEQVDWEEVGVYIATTHSQQESDDKQKQMDQGVAGTIIFKFNHQDLIIAISRPTLTKKQFRIKAKFAG